VLLRHEDAIKVDEPGPIGLRAPPPPRRTPCASVQRSDPAASGRELPCERDTSEIPAPLVGALPAPVRARRAGRPAQCPLSASRVTPGATIETRSSVIRPDRAVGLDGTRRSRSHL
jgi:hypothetical protein